MLLQRGMTNIPCACTRVRRAARSLTSLYDSALEPVGLQITQFSLLRTIDRMAPVNVSTLAGAMLLDRSTLGRNLTVLERRGLLELTGGADMRERSVTLAPAARRLLNRALPRWEEAQLAVEKKIGRTGVAELFRLLEKLETR
jgi:DNA-binding MarR family transcriptional regulator